MKKELISKECNLNTFDITVHSFLYYKFVVSVPVWEKGVMKNLTQRNEFVIPLICKSLIEPNLTKEFIETNDLYFMSPFMVELILISLKMNIS